MSITIDENIETLVDKVVNDLSVKNANLKTTIKSIQKHNDLLDAKLLRLVCSENSYCPEKNIAIVTQQAQNYKRMFELMYAEWDQSIY